MAKKITAVMILSVFLVLSAEATMVSFVVIETGLPQEEGRNQHSIQWENALLDVFFDAGYIVSNAPMVRLNSRPSMKVEEFIREEINNAREGGADFFIVAQLDFLPDTNVPNDISLVLFGVTPSVRIFENQVTGKTYRSEREEFDDLKLIIRQLVPYLRVRR